MNLRITLTDADAGELLKLIRRSRRDIERAVDLLGRSEIEVDFVQAQLLLLDRIERKLQNALPATGGA
jgi:hypothetical protein